SEFEKDYHRIVSSASFRRLQDKTQVFPLDKSDFIRTRLTHSLEVSSLAKSLGQNISEYILQNHMAEDFTYRMKEDVGTILMCAGLIHDIGNPPFGHFGEDSIREWFQKHLGDYSFKGTPVTKLLSRQMLRDFYYFEGNAQAFRLVTKLHYLVNEHGMNLTYGLLSTMVKYPVSSTEMDSDSKDVRRQKMGYFLSEENIFREISRETGTDGARHPLSYILEAADDIAYLTADVEDAFKKGCISYDILIRELKRELSAYPVAENFDPFAELEHLYRRGKSAQSTEPKLYAVQNWLVEIQSYLISCATRGFISHYDEIMAGTWADDIFHGTGAEGIRAALHNIAFRNAFESIPILRIEVGAGKMMDDILERLIPAFILYDTDEKIGMIEHKMTQLVSENYRQIYHFYSDGKSEIERLYLRLLLVTDYVSGMTDSFARDLYQEVNGIL
ncbi:MAG TPA: deoxyguanosinetriphosphate triphosphohydrolase, partial [Lachnospiraceae bacterium]|nr:deoxyguanosinetriphosphate triphosphohydrolase [Lachnospiraceae bacterium]